MLVDHEAEVRLGGDQLIHTTHEIGGQTAI
jgi:hypothetical protein